MGYDWVNTTPTQSLLPQTSKSAFNWASATQPTSDWNSDIQKYNLGLLQTAPNIADYSAVAGGLGNYGTYDGVGLDKAAYDAIANTGATIGLDKNLYGYGQDALSGLAGQLSNGGLLGNIKDILGIYSAFTTPAGQKEVIQGLQLDNTAKQEAIDDKNKFQASVAAGSKSAFAV